MIKQTVSLHQWIALPLPPTSFSQAAFLADRLPIEFSLLIPGKNDEKNRLLKTWHLS
jgi:hypothetical protein